MTKKASACVSPNESFIDIDLPVSSQTMAIDGFHPNEVFYSAWAKRISKSIIK